MTEYRLVAVQGNGKLKPWPKRNLAHAEKAKADLLRDIAERRCWYRDPYIEQREVGPWQRVEVGVGTGS